MPTIRQNLREWERRFPWIEGGDGWPDSWGDADAHWNGTIFPRISAYLPVRSTLEIAPGYGRWSRLLLGHTERLVGVDLAPRCVAACRARFAGQPAEFHQNDGRSLPMIADRSIDFAFSYDSLVHVEADVLGAYLAELARVLTPGGVAFLHHSNMGQYRWRTRALSLIPRDPRSWLMHRGLLPADAWRAYSVSAVRVADMAHGVGLTCVRQELVPWAPNLLSDCFSTLRRAP